MEICFEGDLTQKVNGTPNGGFFNTHGVLKATRLWDYMVADFSNDRDETLTQCIGVSNAGYKP